MPVSYTHLHRWGEEETANAPLDTVAAELSKSVIYDDAGDVADAEYVGCLLYTSRCV